MKNLKNYIFILIILLGLFFLYIKKAHLKYFLDINVFELIALLAISYLGFLMLGFSFKFILKIFALTLSFREWFGLTVCNSMFNYYLPAKGGTIAKAFYLKKYYGFGYSYYISLMTGSTIIGFALIASIGLIGVFLTYILTDRFLSIFAILFSLLLAGSLLSGVLTKFALRLKINIRHKKFNSLVINLKEGISYFRTHRKLTLYFCLFSILFILFMSIRLYICFIALDQDVNFLDILIIRSITEFSFLISLVPGNLGIKEGIIIFSAGIFNIHGDQVVVAVILDRAVSMFFVFGLGFLYSKILLGELSKERAKEVVQ